MTGPAPDAQPNEHEPGAGPSTGAPGSMDGPPGGDIFTLEGRRAPGLYLVAWILSVGGLAIWFLGWLASDATAAGVLLFVGSAAAALGFAAGAGSQVLERATRDPERYRGPAPLLVFGIYFFAMALIGLVLIVLIGVDPAQPFSFLGVSVVQAAGYVLVVWLVAVRSGALSWREMGWPSWRGPRIAETLRGAGAAALLMVPVTLGLLVVGGIVGLLLGVDAPQVLPLSETALDGFMVALAAAIVIPVGEELFFRGFALTAWLRDLGPRSALVRSSLFFGLIHTVNIAGVDFATGASQAVLQAAVLLPVAFVLGWLFLRYGMAGAIAGHVTYNSLLLTLFFLASKLPEPDALGS